MIKQKYPVTGKGKAQTLSISEMKIEIDGMKVVFEKKVALLPVNIIETKK